MRTEDKHASGHRCCHRAWECVEATDDTRKLETGSTALRVIRNGVEITNRQYHQCSIVGSVSVRRRVSRRWWDEPERYRQPACVTGTQSWMMSHNVGRPEATRPSDLGQSAFQSYKRQATGAQRESNRPAWPSLEFDPNRPSQA